MDGSLEKNTSSGNSTQAEGHLIAIIDKKQKGKLVELRRPSSNVSVSGKLRVDIEKRIERSSIKLGRTGRK